MEEWGSHEGSAPVGSLPPICLCGLGLKESWAPILLLSVALISRNLCCTEEFSTFFYFFILKIFIFKSNVKMTGNMLLI